MEYLWEMGRKTAKLFRMDNDGYTQDPEKGTELNLVDKSTSIKPPSDSEKPSKHAKSDENSTSQRETPSSRSRPEPNPNSRAPASQAGGGGQQPDPGPSTSCRPEVCQRARERYTAPDLRGSPWHRSKTIFLIVTIVALVVWAIVYFTLSKLQIV